MTDHVVARLALIQFLEREPTDAEVQGWIDGPVPAHVLCAMTAHVQTLVPGPLTILPPMKEPKALVDVYTVSWTRGERVPEDSPHLAGWVLEDFPTLGKARTLRMALCRAMRGIGTLADVPAQGGQG